jgi:putative transposase
VRQDGIPFQGFCSLDTTLAAYVGEQVIIRYDPRDMAEIRVFHNHRFLCRAICAALAGETIALREILQARTHRRQALRQTLQDRTRPVDALWEAHRGSHQADEAPMTNESALRLEQEMAHEDTPTLKRYFNA